MIRVALADDDEEICRQLRRILGAAADLEVVGHAHYAAEALDLVVRTTPDVVLLDVRMPGGDGTGIVSTLRAFPDPPAVVMLTNFPTEAAVLTAIEHGAAGFLVKSTTADELVALVRLAASGYQLFDGRVRTMLSAQGQPAAPDLSGLTPRELQVLRGLRDGLSNGRIAVRLGIGEPTVKGHVSSIMVKLHCTSRLQAALLAAGAGSAENAP
ncbi:MAG: response regulator transcription factor [Nakamurella sp.]